MTELWIEFTNELGELEKINVSSAKFLIGRHSDCNISIQNTAVSRHHLTIEQFGEDFVVSDRGSTFGTTIDGNEVSEPVGLKDGQVILLGKEVELRVGLISQTSSEVEKVPEPSNPIVATSSPTSSIPTSFFIIAPIFGLLVLLCAGGGMFIAFSGDKTSERVKNEDIISTTDDDEPSSTPRPTKVEADTPVTSGNSQVNTDSTPLPGDPIKEIEAPSAPKASTDSGKIEQISPFFLRRIVRNDPSAFLTGKQIELLIPKVNQFKSSATLAANIKDAKANSAKISDLAKSTNLTTQFLASAALAKLGNQRGDVAETAKSMVGVLNELNRAVGGEFADDALLVIAAYEQGVAGKFTQMRTQVEALTSKSQGVSARQVRTIWFLHSQGKLSSSEFEFALRFLAIGTITQKPSEFSVNAEALNL